MARGCTLKPILVNNGDAQRHQKSMATRRSKLKPTLENSGHA